VFDPIEHGCTIAWGVIGAVFALYLVLAAATRAFAAAWEFAFAAAIAVLQIVIAVCVAAHHGLGRSHLALLEAADTCVLILLFLPLGKLVIDVLFHVVYLRCVKSVVAAGGGGGHNSHHAALLLGDDVAGGGRVNAADLAAAERAAADDVSATDSDELWSTSSTFSDDATSSSSSAAERHRKSRHRRGKAHPSLSKRRHDAFAREDPDLMPASSDNPSDYNGAGGNAANRQRRSSRRHDAALDALMAGPSHPAARTNPLARSSHAPPPAATHEQFRYMPGFDPAAAGVGGDSDGDDAELEALRAEVARLRGGTSHQQQPPLGVTSTRASTRTANVTVTSAHPHAPRRLATNPHPFPGAADRTAVPGDAYDLL